MRDLKSEPDSAGDRRGGSVGEQPELAASRDNDHRSTKSKATQSADSEENSADPILGGGDE